MGVELPRPPRREMTVVSSEDLRKLADEIEPRYRAWVLTAGVCGLRFGELAGLKRKNVDVLRGRITVAEALVNVDGEGLVWTTPKTHERGVPAFLRPELQEHLTTYTEGGSGPDDLVFTSTRGAPLGHTMFARRYFRPAVKRVLPPERHALRLHDLRHTAASLLIAAGAPITLVAARLGHASPSTTLNVYAHMLTGADESTNAALEAAWEVTSQG